METVTVVDPETHEANASVNEGLRREGVVVAGGTEAAGVSTARSESNIPVRGRVVYQGDGGFEHSLGRTAEAGTVNSNMMRQARRVGAGTRFPEGVAVGIGGPKKLWRR